VPLPVQATSFIGRDREVADVAALLRRGDVRLLTLTGPGGVGKTRLALRVASELSGTFPDGIAFVSLASLVDPQHVVGMVAAMLGVKESGATSLDQSVIQYLRHRHMLVVLDNFEHLQSAAPFVAQLVAACPYLRVLVTSRALLHLSAEQRYEVPPLPAPAEDQLGDLETLARHEAVSLFVARSQAVHDRFVLTPTNAAAVGAICRYLDGLPLAIELAAARTRVFPPSTLLSRLSRRFEVLAGGTRDHAARHQTLRGAIDWSYALLSPHEQRLFARLSIFAAGCTFEAMRAICAPHGGPDLLDALEALVDNSLVRQEGEQDARFAMLETIRAYAAEKLAEQGEHDAVGQRHAEFFLALALEIEPELTGPRQSEALTRLERELDNLRGALGWLRDHGRAADALRLAGALYGLWLVRGQCSEARHWLEEGLARCEGVAPGVRAGALWTLGGIAVELGDNERATGVLEEALALFQALGDDGGGARTLNLLGVAAWRQGAYARAIALYEEALRLATALHDRRERAVALGYLGVVATHQGDFSLARRRLEEALALQRTRGDRHGVMHVLINLGYDATLRGDLREAESMFEEVLATAREFGMKRHLAYALENLGNIATLQDDHARAATRLHEGLLLGQELGDQHLLLYLLSDLTKLEAARGRAERSARLGGAVTALRGQLGIPMSPAEDHSRELYLGRARETLGEAGFNRAWEDGQAMGLQEAMAYALDADGIMYARYTDKQNSTQGAVPLGQHKRH
jgi:predicted ATPase